MEVTSDITVQSIHLHLLRCSLESWTVFWGPLPVVGVLLLGGLQLPELEQDTFALRLWRL